MCLNGVRILGRWCSTPFTEANETLDSVPIGYVLYSRPVCSTRHITLTHVTQGPSPPPSKSRLRIPPGPPLDKRPEPNPPPVPARSFHPLPLPPFRICLVPRLPSTVGGSEPSLAARFQRALTNTSLSALGYAQLGALAN